MVGYGYGWKRIKLLSSVYRVRFEMLNKFLPSVIGYGCCNAHLYYSLSLFLFYFFPLVLQGCKLRAFMMIIWNICFLWRSGTVDHAPSTAQVRMKCWINFCPPFTGYGLVDHWWNDTIYDALCWIGNNRNGWYLELNRLDMKHAFSSFYFALNLYDLICTLLYIFDTEYGRNVLIRQRIICCTVRHVQTYKCVTYALDATRWCNFEQW